MEYKISQEEIHVVQSKLNLPHPLRGYQWEGVSFLSQNSSCLLSDEMGLGKTVQTAVSLETLFRLEKIKRVLVIVPASLKLNWLNELRKWTSTPSIQIIQGNYKDRQAYYLLPINILIASYEEIRLDVMDFVNEVEFDIVILDEAQRIKNPNSKTSLSCKLIRRRISWALTGTPLENRIEDLISVYNFIRLGLLNKALSRREILERIQPFFLRRKKEQVAKELPSIIEQEIQLQLLPNQRMEYDEVLFDERRTIGEKKQADLLAAITKLKQICNYAVLSDESAKYELLKYIIDDHIENEDKLIVFSQYVKTLEWIYEKVENHISTDIYWGGLNQKTRESIISDFRNSAGARLLLISLKAGGVGLNIQEAKSVVLFDRWWNPAVEIQAIHRAHRLGRERPLHVIKFVVQDSIEERIMKILSEKEGLFNDYIEEAENAREIPVFGETTLREILSH
jgi:SNF2 family DNA or RNA helicase